MAKLSDDHKSVTVQKGDTLSQIAVTYKQYMDNPSGGYQYLASINGISDPNKIYVGQVIKLTKSGSSSSSSSKKNNSNQATITAFGLQSNTDNTLFATWKWDKSNTENYEILWEYDSGDKVWFIGSESTTSAKQCTYSYPSNAIKVRFKVKPVSKTYTNNNKETSYWKANWSTEKLFNVSDHPPVKPDTPNDVEIDNFKLTVTMDGLDDLYANKIEFQIVKDNSTVYNTGKADIKTGHTSYSCNVNAGSEYKVRCRSVRDKLYSEWTEYSGNVSSGPTAPSGITKLKASAEKSVEIEWGAVKNAETYEIEYTTKKMYFDSSDSVSSKTHEAKLGNHFIIEGLEPGNEYFFRVRAAKGDQTSAWTEIKSIILGEKPSPPTTWSSTTTVIVGEELNLYWIHNSLDGSSQTYAILELDITDREKQTISIKNSTDEDEKDKTSVYSIDTSKFSEGCKIKWRVKTRGITTEYSDYSIERTVDVYAPPSLSLTVKDSNNNSVDVLESFPLNITGIPGPDTQHAIGYYLTISSNDLYETIDNIGNPVIVNKGDAVYSKYFDIYNEDLSVQISAGDVNLDNNINYTIHCTVSMDSGLTAEATSEFSVSWIDDEYDVNAEVSVDTETITTSIRPYCEDVTLICQDVILRPDKYELGTATYEIEDVDNVYTSTGEIVYMGSTGRGLYYCIVYYDTNGNSIEPEYRNVTLNNGTFDTTSYILNPAYIEDVYTSTGEKVLIGRYMNGTVIRYCTVEKRELVENVKLSVYRREFDGSFTELGTGIDNLKQTFITDPHPALDYARYRIVAISERTGAISYSDLPGIPVGEKGVIIQWDEQWSTFDVSNSDRMSEAPWSGSLLRLLYNVDVSDNNSPDVSLVDYIGRKRPVSYYGTKIGESSSWNVEIDKRDEETLYAIRRLALWMGDVYVREPSGTGYWANISVSYSQKHCDVTIPVSFNITRVEGGM